MCPAIRPCTASDLAAWPSRCPKCLLIASGVRVGGGDTEDKTPGLEMKPPGCRFCDRILPAFLSTLLLGLGLGSDRPGEGGPRRDPRSARLPTGLPAHACALRGEGSRQAGLAGARDDALQGQLRKDKKIRNYVFKEKKNPYILIVLATHFTQPCGRSRPRESLLGPGRHGGGVAGASGTLSVLSPPPTHHLLPCVGFFPPHACHLDRNLKI